MTRLINRIARRVLGLTAQCRVCARYSDRGPLCPDCDRWALHHLTRLRYTQQGRDRRHAA